MAGRNLGVYVCGPPSSGTSAVAGVLHHLGVEMGRFQRSPSARGYVTFEDRDAERFVRPLGRYPGDSVLRFMAGSASGRDFRKYLKWREGQADGRPWGCKLGTSYVLGDPEPETLPLRWIFVDRDLETSIRSDREKRKKIAPEENEVERAMQVAGYWAAKNRLQRRVEGLSIHFDILRSDPAMAVDLFCARLDLDVPPKLRRVAALTVWP